MRYLAVSSAWPLALARGFWILVGRHHYEVHPDLPEAWKVAHRLALGGEQSDPTRKSGGCEPTARSSGFAGRFSRGLKTGYDPVGLVWPAWIERVGVDAALLPDVVAPGVSVGVIAPASARAFGLPADVCIAAGTTDGCASFLATGPRASATA